MCDKEKIIPEDSNESSSVSVKQESPINLSNSEFSIESE